MEDYAHFINMRHEAAMVRGSLSRSLSSHGNVHNIDGLAIEREEKRQDRYREEIDDNGVQVLTAAGDTDGRTIGKSRPSIVPCIRGFYSRSCT